MLQIIIPTLIFTAFITILTATLFFCYKHLTSKKEIKITINNRIQVTAPADENLLSTIQQQSILLPSSCGGKGTCGLCQCQLSPAPHALPTEKSFLPQKELNKGIRLACQQQPAHNVKLTIPSYILNAQKMTATISKIIELSPRIKEFTIGLDQTINYHPGDYILIEIPKFQIGAFKNSEATNRAYSISSHPSEGNAEIKLTVTFAASPDRTLLPDGIGSTWLFNQKEGNKIQLSGPFGEFHLQNTRSEKCFIGGGAGIAPLRSQILHKFLQKGHADKVTFWYGARDARSLVYEEEFNTLQSHFKHFSYFAALSESNKGREELPNSYIHTEVERYLKTHPAPEEIEFYLCGPALMIEATTQMLTNIGVDEENIYFDNFG